MRYPRDKRAWPATLCCVTGRGKKEAARDLGDVVSFKKRHPARSIVRPEESRGKRDGDGA